MAALSLSNRWCGVRTLAHLLYGKWRAFTLTCRRTMAAFIGAAADWDALRGRSGSQRGDLRTLGGRILPAGRSWAAHSQLARRCAHFRLIFALTLPGVPAGGGPY